LDQRPLSKKGPGGYACGTHASASQCRVSEGLLPKACLMQEAYDSYKSSGVISHNKDNEER
jgi:hypothetical protein